MTAWLLKPQDKKNKQSKQLENKNTRSICILCLPKEKWVVSSKKKKQ